MTSTQFADKLVDHLRTCPRCRRAGYGWAPKCPTAKALIKKTLKERHG